MITYCVPNFLTIKFDERLTDEQCRVILEALDKFYRACGGGGFNFEWIEEEAEKQ